MAAGIGHRLLVAVLVPAGAGCAAAGIRAPDRPVRCNCLPVDLADAPARIIFASSYLLHSIYRHCMSVIEAAMWGIGGGFASALVSFAAEIGAAGNKWPWKKQN